MSNYVDLQVNGFVGVDFNSDDLSGDGLEMVCAAMRDCRVARFLPTIITDELLLMSSRIQQIVRLRERSPLAKSMIPGLHVEGPFLSALDGFIGAHPKQYARPADGDAMKRLVDAGEGLVKLVTLAPEQDQGMKVTRWLAAQRIRVAAGHTDASREQLTAALDAGLTGFTHLGNGCPLQLHRHDNIIQRVLSLRDRFTVSLIADGHHLPPWLLTFLLDVLGTDKTFLVTDAISAARLGPGFYRLGSRQITIESDGVARSADGTHFVGSTTDMPKMDSLLEQLGFKPHSRRQLLELNPLEYIGF